MTKDNNQSENIKINSSNNKKVIASNKGLILKNFVIRPFDVNANGIVTVKLSNGKSWKGKLCKDICPISTVELVDFPKSSLFKNIEVNIKNDKNLTFVDEYLDTVSLRCSVLILENGIMVAYIKPPFNKLNKFIQPFIKISELNNSSIFLLFLGGVFTVLIKLMKEPKFQQNFNAPVYGNAQNVEGNQNIYASQEKQTLAEAAEEIQNLLKQLEKTNPTATVEQQQAYVDAAISPTLKQRCVGALLAGGETAIEEFLDNPYVNVGKAVVKGWIKPE